jgi:tetratricopeptide (TPR) repeat protein
MGTVHLVRDRETGEHVALKKLHCVDADSVLRLKREFRALADVRHPNLVKLYDMGHTDDGWFLTMEYVGGKDLVTHVRPQNAEPIPDAECRPLADDVLQRLASIFHQLASGVSALHHAGILHRDLKPANVLVEGNRVAILDFGLVGLLRNNEVKLTEAGAVFGTPEYMAPEQARGTALTEATDWYAFGAMLYEALTGQRACGDGNPFQILMRKFEAPRHPRRIDPALPADLCDLCMALLEIEPEKRPKGTDVLARLEGPQAALEGASYVTGDSAIAHVENRAPAAPFVGREQDLGRLQQALFRAHEQKTVVVHVRGVSGAGKSTLVERFVDDVEAQASVLGRTDILVLRSRCYEREAMPFKALDGLMDSLVRYLSRLDRVEVGHCLPEDVEALAQLFPVLERLGPVQQLLSSRMTTSDAVHVRSRGEVAFRELFRRLASRRPLLLWIDDLQWGDLDSARILTSWLGGPTKSSVLMLFSYRSDEVATSACLQHLLQTTCGVDPPEMLDVGALSEDDIRKLCHQRLSALEDCEELVEHIVREAGGSPFLALHLTSLAAADLARGKVDLQTISLEHLVDRTSAMLSPEARALVAILSVAGRPMLPKLALRAIGVRQGGRALVHELRGLSLVRSREVDGSKLLEIYHDRIREAVCRGLDAGQSAKLHEALLSTLELSGHAEPDWLHALALRAGRLPTALEHGLVAAERSMATLAFERAAELYAECVRLSEGDTTSRVGTMSKLATALACCGRGASAAQIYLDAAKLVPKKEALALMRLAASHLLRTGRFDEGGALLDEVLDAMGLAVPKTRAGLIAAIAWERGRVRLRGLDSNLQADGSASPELQARCDIFEAVRRDLIAIDPLKTAFLSARSLRWALESGEPTRIATALSVASSVAAFEGSVRATRRAQELLAKAAVLAETIDSEAALAVLNVNRALVGWLTGGSGIVEASVEAERQLALAPDPDGAYFMRFATVSVRLGALYDLGRFRQFFELLDKTVDQARSTENYVALLHLALVHTNGDVYRGTPQAALPRLEAQRRLLPKQPFSTFHLLHMLSVGLASFASGDYEWGLARFEEDFRHYLQSPLRKTAQFAYLARSTRVRLHLNAYAANGAKQDVASAVESDLKALAKVPLPVSAPTHREFRARVAALEGKRLDAIAELKKTTKGYADVGCRGRTAIASYAFGLMLGGTEGTSACAESSSFLRGEGIDDPAALVRAFFPEAFENA